MTEESNKNSKKRHHRELQGLVISDKSTKTIVVEVKRRVAHPKYKKYIDIKKKYHVHDEKEEANTGDTVTIVSSRPLSKLKRWQLKEVNQKMVG